MILYLSNNLLTFLQCYVSFELDHYVSELLTMFHCVGFKGTPTVETMVVTPNIGDCTIFEKYNI